LEQKNHRYFGRKRGTTITWLTYFFDVCPIYRRHREILYEQINFLPTNDTCSLLNGHDMLAPESNVTIYIGLCSKTKLSTCSFYIYSITNLIPHLLIFFLIIHVIYIML
jgi:hypothetical protein